ncbi:GAF domain-containing protein [Alkalibacillus aidingensis]|uniref:GAF domain-containing protein n=1 Tax=Alkalibacillus aidingensis TaxID=2747607 RepID=UPI0016606C0A|nr:GAF domain-containing protein [Alkalibacillus aidingensis]
MPNFNYQVEVDQVRNYLNADLVLLAMTSSETNFELRWHYASGNKNNKYKRFVLKSGKGIAGQVFKVGKPMIIENIVESEINQRLYEYPIVLFEDIKSFLAIPLWKNSRVKAVLLVASREKNDITNQTFKELMGYLGKCFGSFDTQEMMV